MALEFHCERSPMFRHGVHIRSFDRSEGQFGAIVEPAVIRRLEATDSGCYIEPVLRLDDTGAQQLMDELWRCGLRPSEGSGSAGSLAATERHLADMKSVSVAALKKLGLDL